MGKAWRNVRCVLCRAKVPERKAERITLNRTPAWLCRPCADRLTEEQ